jgi:hypothetical protein
MSTIMVQISDRQWTMQAVHLACALARNTNASLVLLHLMNVRSPYLLGTEYGVIPPTRHELEDISELNRIAEDYGLEVTLQRMQYVAFTDALVQAVEHTRSAIVFLDLPENTFPFWRKLQLWNLRRQLRALGCRLYTLDEPEQTGEWMPSVSIKAAK